MRARRLLIALLAMVTVGGCASAADVASSQRADKVQEKPAPTTQQTPDPTTPTTRTPPTPTQPTKTTKPAPTKTPPPPPRTRTLPNVVGSIPTFLTPSHNIGCAISSGQVRCDIAEHSYRNPPKPAGCHGAYGQSIAVATTGIAAFVCVTDTVISPRAPVLAYTTSTVVGDFGCTSRQAGIRCYYLKSKHGFWLSRDQPALF